MSFAGERDFLKGNFFSPDGTNSTGLKTLQDIETIVPNFRQITTEKLLRHGLTQEESAAFFLDPLETHPKSQSAYFLKGRIGNSEILGAATTEDTYSSEHYHPEGLGERYCVIGGNVIVVMEGQDFPLAAGDVMDIPPNTYHHVYTEKDAYGLLLIHMEDALLFPAERRHLGRREAQRRAR